MSTGKKRSNRLRKAYNFSLSNHAIATLDTLAERLHLTRCRALETLLITDHVEVFDLFRRKASFADIVIRTKLAPAIVRSLYREYTTGFAAIEPSTTELDKRIELERLRLQTAEVICAAKERRAIIAKSGVMLRAEAMVRAAKVAAGSRTRKSH